MPKSGGAVIPMQINLSAVKQLCGAHSLESLNEVPSRVPFDAEICEFLKSLSAKLLSDKEAKTYPDIVTFAFFCRKANLAKLQEEYTGKIENRLGRGIAFHIAPSNVPINFAYTLVAGLLAGNVCVVKASGKDFAQTRIIAKHMNALLEEMYPALRPYVNVVVYDRTEQEVTEYFSALCNVRVIWGGDETVAAMRKAELAPRAFDIAFADRYSLMVFKASAILQTDNMAHLAQDFYNDTYLYDQNACSAPRLIYWIGEPDEIAAAKEKFWSAVHAYISPIYPIEPVVAVNKYVAFCRSAIELNDVREEPMPDNLISRMQIKSLSEALPEYRCAGGSFFEYDDIELQPLAAIVTSRYQTLGYYGLKPQELREWVRKNGLSGIDRIVPVGKTADFTMTWDGYDLILTLSRIIFAQ